MAPGTLQVSVRSEMVTKNTVDFRFKKVATFHCFTQLSEINTFFVKKTCSSPPNTPWESKCTTYFRFHLHMEVLESSKKCQIHHFVNQLCFEKFCSPNLLTKQGSVQTPNRGWDRHQSIQHGRLGGGRRLKWSIWSKRCKVMTRQSGEKLVMTTKGRFRRLKVGSWGEKWLNWLNWVSSGGSNGGLHCFKLVDLEE